jgi:hypothetical protein
MKIEELLQKIIDIAIKDDVVDQTEFQSTEYEEPLGVFLPPLQANLELMKKATGVDNVIDGEQAEEYEDEWQELATDPDDELLAIRHLSGLPIDAEVEHPAAVVISQSTEPRF